jgi:YD repeat-containing protein
VGLRAGFTRTSSGVLTGFETDNRRRTGATGTAYFNRSRTLSSTSVAVGDTYVIRPYVTLEHEFPSAQTSDTGFNETSYTVAFHTSSLAIKSIVTTLPVVSTGNNGSNSADTYRKYWNLDGTLGFEKDQGGHITYHEYTKGQETKSIEDADTTKTAGGEDFNGVAIPTGFSSSGTPLHWKTTVAYDAQGRQDSTTMPSAQVSKHYYSKLADMRPVHLGYNDYVVTPKWYGPVRYTVSNHAGKPTMQATVALTSNESTTALTGHIDETDADPITAMDVRLAEMYAPEA